MNYVIHNSDGDTHVTAMTDEELSQALAEEYWGKVEILDRVPENSDTNYWGKWDNPPLLIIRGEVIVPGILK